MEVYPSGAETREGISMTSRNWRFIGSALLAAAAVAAVSCNLLNRPAPEQTQSATEPSSAGETAMQQAPEPSNLAPPSAEQAPPAQPAAAPPPAASRPVRAVQPPASTPERSAAPERAVAPAPPPPPPVNRATFAAGTPLIVRTTTAISTKTARSGERFVASLEEPLMEGTWMVAPKGATVEGVVVTADPGGKVKGVASLSVKATGFTTADGQRIEVSTAPVTFEAKSSTKKDALKVGIATGVGAAIGAIAGGGKGAAIGAGVGAGAGTGGVLLTRGDAAVLPSETVVSFELAAPVTVTEKR
jgi:hypothetical protein